MSTRVVTAPSVEIVTLDEAKAHLRVDGTDEDALIGALIVAAREQAEHRTGRAFGAQVREMIIDAFPSAEIRLDGTPVTNIISVSYADTAGATQVLDASAYVLDQHAIPSWLLPSYGTAWPATYDTANAVVLRYDCGQTAGVDSVRAWMLLALGTWYKQREAIVTGAAVAQLPHAFWDGLLDRYRIYC